MDITFLLDKILVFVLNALQSNTNNNDADVLGYNVYSGLKKSVFWLKWLKSMDGYLVGPKHTFAPKNTIYIVYYPIRLHIDSLSTICVI